MNKMRQKKKKKKRILYCPLTRECLIKCCGLSLSSSESTSYKLNKLTVVLNTVQTAAAVAAAAGVQSMAVLHHILRPYCAHSVESDHLAVIATDNTAAEKHGNLSTPRN